MRRKGNPLSAFDQHRPFFLIPFIERTRLTGPGGVFLADLWREPMIDGLIAGRIYGDPQRREDANGKFYSVGKVKAATSGGENLLVSVIVFGDAAQQFLALSDGDSVALAGSLTPKVWTDKEGQQRPGLDMQAHQVLSMYQLQKKRHQAQE